MAENFLGEIRLFSFGFAPKYWAQCNGQLLSIQQNQALFSILGATFGGNGVTTFALPNLQGAVPIGPSSSITAGTPGGEETHTLTLPEMAAHTHTAIASSAAGGARSPNGAVWAGTASASYTTSPNTMMSTAGIDPAGGGQAHANMQPYLVINFCIALQGIFPSRN